LEDDDDDDTENYSWLFTYLLGRAALAPVVGVAVALGCHGVGGCGGTDRGAVVIDGRPLRGLGVVAGAAHLAARKVVRLARLDDAHPIARAEVARQALGLELGRLVVGELDVLLALGSAALLARVAARKLDVSARADPVARSDAPLLIARISATAAAAAAATTIAARAALVAACKVVLAAAALPVPRSKRSAAISSSPIPIPVAIAAPVTIPIPIPIPIPVPTPASVAVIAVTSVAPPTVVIPVASSSNAIGL